MIYWAEGDNGPNAGSARVTNTDYRMIKIFISFATKICGVNKDDIKIGVILYPDLNEKNACDSGKNNLM